MTLRGGSTARGNCLKIWDVTVLQMGFFMLGRGEAKWLLMWELFWVGCSFRASETGLRHYFRYFEAKTTLTNEIYWIMRPKKVKLAEHDKLLKKVRHKEAFLSVLGGGGGGEEP